MSATVTLEEAKAILNTVDQGLCGGIGNSTPGDMCVEAVVCALLEGEGQDDHPKCVTFEVAEVGIGLNDRIWSSNKARAEGLRRFAIAQLGSAGVVDGKAFARALFDRLIVDVNEVSPYGAAKARESRDNGGRVGGCIVALQHLGYGDGAKIRAAEHAVEVLRELGSPGVKLMDELGL